MNREEFSAYLVSVIKPFLISGKPVMCDTVQDNLGTLFLLDVPKEDMGRVIGSDGKVIDAIRTVVHYASLNHGFEANIKVKNK